MRTFTKSTIYQIYIKSFQDSNGDGIGDICGVTSRLNYLKELGVDYIWLTPFLKSPLNDNGYDIADYYSIDKVFGSMADFEELIAKAGEKGIGIMMDMVFNHTSTEHEWFQRALSGEKKYMDYYIFRDPKNGKEPTNWQSKFGGSAWEWVPKLKKYYLHLFDISQADLNWDNKAVRDELKKILKFWKAKGVKGFRFDMLNLISKPHEFEDDNTGDGKRFYTDGPNVHEYIREMVRESGIEGMVTVGEMSATSIDNCVKYTNENNQELNMTFSFHHLKVDYKNGYKWELMKPDIEKLKQLLSDWQSGMEKGGGWNALCWCNHDQPRIVSRFGDDLNYLERSAKMLGTAIQLLRGTPYIFQGEEIGITNAYFTDISQYRDVESLNYYKILLNEGKSEQEALEILSQRSRDNGRTPMQWDDGENAGFSKGKPWIEVNKNYRQINVKSQLKDFNSVFNYYKKLVEIRKQYEVISDGSFREMDKMPKEVFAYKRILGKEEVAVFLNFSDKEQQIKDYTDLKEYKLLISNIDNKEKVDILLPFEASAYIK